MFFKDLIKSFFAKNPWIYRSRLIYNIQRWRQKGNVKPDYDFCKYPEILKEIDVKGCTIIRGFISPEQASQILEDVEAPMKEVKNGKKNKDYWEADGGNPRIGNIDNYSPSAKELLYQSELIENVAKSFVSERAVGFRKEVDFKYNEGQTFQADIVHIDDWRHRFKAFLLLNDISADNAPLVYYERSHKSANWRPSLEYSYHRDGIKGRFGHVFPQEMRAIQAEYNYPKVTFEGKAGDLFLGDFRGLHSGSPLKSGKRVMLNYTWGLT